MNTAPILTTLLLTWATNVAGADLPEPNWNPLDAVTSADTTEARNSLHTLFQLVRDGRNAALLEQVEAIAQGSIHSDPERDYVLHTLAVALGDFEPGLVGPEVLEYLRQTRSRVNIPHEENPNMGVPLYNIRAAASGSLAAWERRQQDPAAPGLRYIDAESFVASLDGVRSPDLAAYVREAQTTFDPAERELIVLATADLDNAAVASVIIAEMAPQLLGRPAVDDWLFDLLGHGQLGASAALILGQSGNAAILERLAATAAGEDTLVSRRASLAIDLYLSGDDQ